MTPSELKTKRHALGLTAEGFGRFVGLTGHECDRSVRRWERGDRRVPETVVMLLALADAYPDVMNWLRMRLEKKMRRPENSS